LGVGQATADLRLAGRERGGEEEDEEDSGDTHGRLQDVGKVLFHMVFRNGRPDQRGLPATLPERAPSRCPETAPRSARDHGSSLSRIRRNSNRPYSDWRPMVPFSGTFIALPIISPLHLQTASVPLTVISISFQSPTLNLVSFLNTPVRPP